MGMLWIRIGLLLTLAGCALSCYGGGTTPPPKKPSKPTKPTKPPSSNTTNATDTHTDTDLETVDPKKNKSADFLNTVLGGWPPQENLTQLWTHWFDDYKTKVEQEKAMAEFIRTNLTKEQREKLMKERGDWPKNWLDLGPGHSGEVPPPWAYIPKNTGLPDFCYEWPQSGNCKESLLRWGFNSYANRCDQFLYTGCGGNQNNFKEKLSCEQACMIPPVSGCDTESQIPAFEDYENILDQ